MNNNALMNAIDYDVKAIKSLEMQIIPAKIYYRKLFLNCLLVYGLFLIIQLIACFVAIETGFWREIDEREQNYFHTQMEFNEHDNALLAIRDLVNTDSASALKLKQQARAEAKIKAQQALKQAHVQNLKHAHAVGIFNIISCAMFGALVFTGFFVSVINRYVIFQQQIRKQLQTGDYLHGQFILAFKLYFVIFGILALVTIALFDQSFMFFSSCMAFICSALISSMLINMELSRIGVNVLTTAMQHYFHK